MDCIEDGSRCGRTPTTRLHQCRAGVPRQRRFPVLANLWHIGRDRQ